MSKEEKNEQVRRLLLGVIGWAVPPSLNGAAPVFAALEDQWVAEGMKWLKDTRKPFPLPPTWLLAPGFVYHPHCLPLDTLARACQQVLAEEKPVEKPVEKAPMSERVPEAAAEPVTEVPAATSPAPA